MKRIEVKLSLTVVAPLLDVIKSASQSLRQNLAAPLAMGDLDAEFRKDWTAELQAGQSSDVQVLLSLFDENFFSESVIGLDATNAEPVIRACAAVRLRLREQYLRALDDEILESSDIELEQLDEPVRKAFMCYLFLATLQELIIQHLDSTIIDG
jgi:hypothetical protein